MGAMYGEDFATGIGEFSSGDTRANFSGHGAKGFGDNLATGTEFFELFDGSDRHGASERCRTGNVKSTGLKTRPYHRVKRKVDRFGRRPLQPRNS